MVSVPGLDDLFLRFHFAQTAELAKTLLVLGSAVLVSSLIFAPRLVGLAAGFSRAKVAVVGSWSALVVAIALAGLSICMLMTGVGRAGQGADPSGAASRSDALLLGSGVLFVVGLVGLIAAAILAMDVAGSPSPEPERL
jgi:hypothetical protein